MLRYRKTSTLSALITCRTRPVVSLKWLPGRAIERAILSTAAIKVFTRHLAAYRTRSDHGKDDNSIVGSMFNLDISHISSIAVCKESARGFVASRLGS